jgi:hypothetical protein
MAGCFNQPGGRCGQHQARRQVPHQTEHEQRASFQFRLNLIIQEKSAAYIGKSQEIPIGRMDNGAMSERQRRRAAQGCCRDFTCGCSWSGYCRQAPRSPSGRRGGQGSQHPFHNDGPCHLSGTAARLSRRVNSAFQIRPLPDEFTVRLAPSTGNFGPSVYAASASA